MLTIKLKVCLNILLSALSVHGLNIQSYGHLPFPQNMKANQYETIEGVLKRKNEDISMFL